MEQQNECDLCGVPTSHFHYTKSGWACNDCYVPPRRDTDTNLGKKTGNKYLPHQTYADKMNIVTRRIHPDGIVRANPRWETKEW